MTQTDVPDIFHRFPSGTIEVRDALDRTRADLQSAHVDIATIDSSQIILGEVLNNVVEHAYRQEDGHPIEVSIWLRHDGLFCKIRDKGLPMPNDAPPDGVLVPLNTSSRDTLPEGGFGWALVHELTRDLRYFRTDGTNELQFLIPALRP